MRRTLSPHPQRTNRVTSSCLSGEDFHNRRLTFQPDTENVLSSVNVPIMVRPAVTAFPMPYSKRTHTFRAAVGNSPAARARLGSKPLRNDAHYAACRNRLVRQHIAEHRPTSIRNRLSHFRSLQIGRAHISDVNFRVVSDNLSRGHVEKMLSLVCDLGRKGSGASLLPPTLERCQFLFGSAIEGWRLYGHTIAQDGQRLQSKIYSNGNSFAPFRFRDLNLNVDVPAPSRIGRKVPRLGFSILRNWSMQPKVISALAKGQDIAVQLGGPCKVTDRYPIKISSVGSEARGLREGGIPSVSKLGADRINRIGMNAKINGHSTAEIGKIKGGRPTDHRSAAPPLLGLSVNLATVIPDEVDSPRLSAKGAPCRISAVADAVSRRQKHAIILANCRLFRHIKEAASVFNFLPQRTSAIHKPRVLLYNEDCRCWRADFFAKNAKNYRTCPIATYPRKGPVAQKCGQRMQRRNPKSGA